MDAIRIIIPLLVALIGCSASERNTVRISFTGDIIMHIPVKSCAREQNVIDPSTGKSANDDGFDFLFEKIRDRLSASDEAIGNMEFPVSPPFTSKPMIFNCNPSVLKALKKSGFTMMHTANNHILDQDPEGAVNTLRYLRESGIGTLGVDFTEDRARAGIVKTIKGIRVGFIGYTDLLNYPLPRKNGSFSINLLNRRDRVTEDIAKIRPLCDYLVMVVHTGEEYSLDPSESTKKLLRFYIDRGVDLVVGHHPHVLQPAEKITAEDGRQCMIFYSLGNFISNQSSAHPLSAVPGMSGAVSLLSTRDSVILTLHLRKENEKIIRTFSVEPVITVNLRPPGGKRVIQTVSLPDLIRGIKEKHPVGAAENGTAPQEAKELIDRLGAIRSTIFRYGPMDDVQFIGL